MSAYYTSLYLTIKILQFALKMYLVFLTILRITNCYFLKYH
jgi:hypothetical protein